MYSKSYFEGYKTKTVTDISITFIVCLKQGPADPFEVTWSDQQWSIMGLMVD